MEHIEYLEADDPGRPVPAPHAPPEGWQPTRERPIPAARCTVIKPNSDRCNNWTVRGYEKCFIHMKRHQFPNAATYADAVVESARLRLFGDAEVAIETLEALTQPGTGDAIRLKAATEILDRVGIRGGTEIKVQSDVQVDNSSVEELNRRLERLSKASLAIEAVEKAREDEIVDAEVVEDEETDELPAV